MPQRIALGKIEGSQKPRISKDLPESVFFAQRFSADPTELQQGGRLQGALALTAPCFGGSAEQRPRNHRQV
jgi:hypothetical protein